MRRIEALRDGALAPEEARRVRQRLEGNPDAATVLRRTDALGRAIRVTFTEAPPAPDPEILLLRLRSDLARVDAELAEAGWAGRLRVWARALAPARGPFLATGGLAAAAVALMLAVPPLLQDEAGPGIARADSPAEIRSLSSSGTVFVLEGADGCTIIWVMDEDPGVSSTAQGGEFA